MSHSPESSEPGHDNLRRAAANLPAHEPDATTWPRIVAQLATEQVIASAVQRLPEHEPADELWDNILGRLEASDAPMLVAADAKRPTTRTLRPAAVWRAVGIAAAVLILLGIWWLRPVTATDGPVITASRETVTISEEVVAPPSPTRLVSYKLDPLDQEGEDFIDAHCASLPNVCHSKEFRALRTQLDELQAQEHRLQQATRRFGESPELVRQQAELTTMRATVTRELVQLIIS